MAVRPTPVDDDGPVGLDDLVAIFRRWYHLPIVDHITLALATVVANRMPGPAVWLAIVGQSSGGKSTLLDALEGLDDIRPIDDVSVAGLLSGSQGSDEAATGGVLASAGDRDTLMISDMSTITDMHHEAKGRFMAALRRVYDGSYTRAVGTAGGRSFKWGGDGAKIGFLGGAVDLDEAVGMMGALGQRFVLYRLPEVGDDDAVAMATRADANRGSEAEAREATRSAVAGRLTELGDLAQRRPVHHHDVAALASLARFAGQLRGGTKRDPRSRELEGRIPPEAPTRLAGVLGQLLAAMEALGVEADEAWRLVIAVALAGCPDRRRMVLEVLLGSNGRMSTHHVAAAVAVASTAAVHRDLEDLTAHGLAELMPDRGEHWWKPTDDARQRWERFFAAPPAVEPNDEAATAAEVAELEAAYAGQAVPCDPLDEDF